MEEKEKKIYIFYKTNLFLHFIWDRIMSKNILGEKHKGQRGERLEV